MVCKKCGNPLCDTDTYCSKCGRKIDVIDVINTSQPQPRTNPNPPNETLPILSLILGIISIVLGFSGVWGIILGIVAIVLANSSEKLPTGEPQQKANTGKKCGIVGICIGAVMLVLVIALFSVWGLAVSQL